jgi:hypothetical protein
MTAEAVKIWSENEGTEAKRGDFPPVIDITKYQGEAFRCKFTRREDYTYQYEKMERQGVAIVCEFIKTSAKGAKVMNPSDGAMLPIEQFAGKPISIYSRGLLTYQFGQLGIKEGDVFVASCTGQQEIGGGKKPYQFVLKRIA